MVKYRYEVIMLAGMTPEQRSAALSELGEVGYRLMHVDQGMGYLEFGSFPDG